MITTSDPERHAKDIVFGAADVIEQIVLAMREEKILAFNSKDLELMQFIASGLRQIGASLEVYSSVVN